MKKYRLKKWVLPSVYLMSVGIIGSSLSFVINNALDVDKVKGDFQYVLEEEVDSNVLDVVKETNETVDHPYLLESVKIAKDFYNSESAEENKLNSLLFYKNTYMQNTGILYTANEEFNVVSVLDGTVTSITKDDILGTVVEIMHTPDLITSYQCLNSTTLNVGDQVNKNDIIGKSGKVNIDNGYDNALLFEVIYKGSIMNPNDLYNMKLSEINK